VSISDPSKPCVFFDRDGVINRSPGDGYVLSWEGFHFLPGLPEILQLVHNKSYMAIVVTSQRCIGKGLISEDAVADIHGRMQRELAETGHSFDAIYACTGQAHDAHWAKPSPEMIHAAARDFPIDVPRSILIGDRDRDIQMGLNAGVRKTIRLRGDREITIPADYTVDDLPQAREVLKSLL
jgi:D-glycero-D-manno-heptose 1,7-bisphosphate phosphatase